MWSDILNDRHKSIAAYLQQSGHTKSFVAFKEEIEGGSELLSEETCKQYESVLEKKWITVLRLSKKVIKPSNNQSANYYEFCVRSNITTSSNLPSSILDGGGLVH